MTDAQRRPSSRRWLLLPLMIAAVAFAAWSAYWFVARGRIITAFDQAEAAQEAEGRRIEYASRKVGGYPFRFKVELTQARIASPSGWTLRAPRLQMQALAYQLTRWTASASDGVVVRRPIAGPLHLDTSNLRASLSAPNGTPPRISVVGTNIRFTPLEGAEPFLLAAAERAEFHLRPATDAEGQAALVFRVRGAQPRPAGLMTFVSGPAPANFVWDSRVTHFAALKGETWAGAVRNWTRAGGRMQVTDASLQAGDLRARSQGGELSASADGRLRGRLNVQLNRPLQALSVMSRIEQTDPNALGAATAVARAQGERDVELALGFEAGQFTVGPIAIAPAPKVF